NQSFLAFWEWQVNNSAGVLAGYSHPQTARWRDALEKLTVLDDLNGRTRALLDVLLLYVGVYRFDLRQLWYLGQTGSKRDAYVEAFVKAAHDSRLPHRQRLLTGLHSAALGVSWDSDEALAGLLELLTAL